MIRVTVFLLILASALAVKADALEDAVKASVHIECANGYFGSGVCQKVGETQYVWTAGHVVNDAHKNNLKVFVRYVAAESDDFVATRLCDAEVAAVDPVQDIAVLKITSGTVPGSVDFDINVQPLGTAIWHIGTPLRYMMINSVSEGIVSGRHRRLNNSIFDQCTVVSRGGCSGGGMFRKSDGKCIGLLNCSANDWDSDGDAYQPSGFIFFNPARKLAKFAKDNNIPFEATND